jgi:high-affinity iron transporter
LISILILVLFGFNINTIINVLPVDTLEWFYSFTVFVSVVISIVFFRYPHRPMNRCTLMLIVVATVLVHLPQSTSLWLYVLTKSQAPNTSLTVLLTGLSLGALVSLALAICWYLLAVYALSRRYVVWAVLWLFIAGRVVLIEQWLAQIGWLTWTEPLVDMSQWFNESSVLGVLVHALLGINATLSVLELSVYLFVLVLGAAWGWRFIYAKSYLRKEKSYVS